MRESDLSREQAKATRGEVKEGHEKALPCTRDSPDGSEGR